MNIKQFKQFFRENGLIILDAEIPIISEGGRIHLNVKDWDWIEGELSKIELELILEDMSKKQIINEED